MIANSKMSGAQLKTKLEKVGFSQSGFARKFGKSDRTVRDWIAENYPVPMWVEVVLQIMIDNKLGPEDL